MIDKKYIKESNIPEKMPGALTQPLALLRDNIIEANAATPYEASFLTSMLGELIRHKLMSMNSGRLNPPLDTTQTFEGFRQILQVLTTPKTMRDKKINDTLKNKKVYFDNPNFGANREAGVPDEKNPRRFEKYFILDAFDILKDFIERAVLANTYFTANYKYKVNTDGIAVIEKLEELSDEDEVESIIGLTYNELTPQAKAKIDILENHPKTAGLLVAYDNNWATLVFTNETRARQRGLYNIFRDVFTEEFNEADINNRHFSMSWCIYSSGGSGYNYSNHEDTLIFLTISLRPLKELEKEINELYSKRNNIIAETYRYNPTINLSRIHKMDNSPHEGSDYPRRPSYLEPAMTYKYEDLRDNKKITRKLKDIRAHGNFVVDNNNNLIEYNGDKNVTTLIIPEGVRVLKKHSITDFPYLHTLVLPASVTMIETSAIRYCQRLRYIQVSDRLKIVEENFIDNSERIFLGVFNREEDSISVRPPKGLIYLDSDYANRVGYENPAKVNTIKYNSKQLYQQDIEVDPNRIQIINEPDLKVYKKQIININLEEFSKVFELPSGVVDTSIIKTKFKNMDLPEDSIEKQIGAWLVDKLIIDTASYKDNESILIDFVPSEIEIKNTNAKGPSIEISLIKPMRLHRLSTHALNLKYFKNLNFLRELYIYIDDEALQNTSWVDNINTMPRKVGWLNLGLNKIVTNDPVNLYNALKSREVEYIDSLNIYKGNNLKNPIGKVDINDLKEGKETIIEIKRHNNIKNLITEIVHNSSDIVSYTQLIKQLKTLDLLDKDQLLNIVNRMAFIPENPKDYKSIELTVGYIQLPIILNSEIKVKLVSLTHEDGVILVLPNNISDSYEELKENPSSLSEINTNLSLYAEIIGFDPYDADLQNIIKKAYLSAGDSLAAFEVPTVEQEKQVEEPTDSFDSLPNIDQLPEEMPDDFVSMDNFNFEDLDVNLESIKKFKLKTNSLNNVINNINKNTPELVLENIRMARLNKVLLIEVNNKNIYKQLKATPNIAKTMLRRFGEYIKSQENSQLIESYNTNGKRYFVLAEQASNNYWYTKEDDIQLLEENSNYIVPKKEKLLILKNSNVRLEERKVIPRIKDNRLVFIKGGK